MQLRRSGNEVVNHRFTLYRNICTTLNNLVQNKMPNKISKIRVVGFRTIK